MKRPIESSFESLKSNKFLDDYEKQGITINVSL